MHKLNLGDKAEENAIGKCLKNMTTQEFTNIHQIDHTQLERNGDKK